MELLNDDFETIALAACSLDESPQQNWVEKAGGLPNYICEIARALKRGGMSTSRAIATAVNRVKRWAAGGEGVTSKTQAKAAKAVAEWEKLKAKAKSDNVKLSNEDDFELTMNDLLGFGDMRISDSILAQAAMFEDCSRPLRLSHDQKDILRLAVLTSKKRKRLRESTFAIPEKRKYPIPDEDHARNALTRVMQFGTEEEKKKVIRAVHKKFPQIKLSEKLKKYL